jgi:hypothetical protein
MSKEQFMAFIDYNQDEKWEEINGYEGLYWVSSIGRIISKRGSTYKLRKLRLRKDGYLEVKLCSNYKSKSFLVHRIVVSHFVSKHTGKLNCTNHINNIRTDNRVCNLEICDYAYNNKYAYENGFKKKISMNGVDNPKSLSVVQIDLKGNYINEFISKKDAKSKIGIVGILSIYKFGKKLCTNKGYVFMLKNDYEKIKKPDCSIDIPKFRVNETNKRIVVRTKELEKVVQLGESGDLIKIFDSVKVAETQIGKKGIVDVCRKRVSIDKNGYTHIHSRCGGYKWMYYKDYIKNKLNK